MEVRDSLPVHDVPASAEQLAAKPLLRITGLVAEPKELTLADLAPLPRSSLHRGLSLRGQLVGAETEMEWYPPRGRARACSPAAPGEVRARRLGGLRCANIPFGRARRTALRQLERSTAHGAKRGAVAALVAGCGVLRECEVGRSAGAYRRARRERRRAHYSRAHRPQSWPALRLSTRDIAPHSALPFFHRVCHDRGPAPPAPLPWSRLSESPQRATVSGRVVHSRRGGEHEEDRPLFRRHVERLGGEP